MKVWVELDLPPVPKELLVFGGHVPNRQVGDIGYGKKQIKEGRELVPCSYTNTTITYEPLLEWLYANLDFVNDTNKIFYQYQTAGAHIVHTDLKRRWALNYFFETGGNDVKTAWYQQHNKPLLRATKQPGQQTDSGNVDYSELDKVEEIICEPGKWYLISTGVLHDVDSVQTVRKSISIGFFGEDVINELRNLWVTND